MLPEYQKKPLDYSVKNWVGDWFLPKLGNKYLIPENSAEHKIRTGQVGECIGRRVSQFNMSWALMKYDNPIEPGTANEPIWVRTMFLTDDLHKICDHHEWGILEGTKWTSRCINCGVTK